MLKPAPYRSSGVSNVGVPEPCSTRHVCPVHAGHTSHSSNLVGITYEQHRNKRSLEIYTIAIGRVDGQ